MRLGNTGRENLADRPLGKWKLVNLRTWQLYPDARVLPGYSEVEGLTSLRRAVLSEAVWGFSAFQFPQSPQVSCSEPAPAKGGKPIRHALLKADFTLHKPQFLVKHLIRVFKVRIKLLDIGKLSLMKLYLARCLASSACHCAEVCYELTGALETWKILWGSLYGWSSWELLAAGRLLAGTAVVNATMSQFKQVC